MKKLYSAILILTIALLSITNVYSQNKKGELKKNHLGIEKLNLTEDQEEKFNEIRFAHQEKAIDMNAQLRKNQLEIKKIFSSSNISEQDVMGLTKKSSDLRAELQRSKVKMWFDVNKILNDKQKQIWKEHIQEIVRNKKARFERNNSARAKKDNFRSKGSRGPHRNNMND